MEEKKIDSKTILGFVLITGLMLWMMYNNISDEKKSMAEDAKKAKTEKVEQAKQQEIQTAVATVSDSAKAKALQGVLGSFAYSAALPSAKDTVTEIKNGLLTLKIANKGGYISEAVVNNFESLHKGSKKPIELIKNNNANLNLQIQTRDNRVLNTKDLYFEPTLTKEGENQVLAMRLKAGESQFLEYRYVLKPNDYMLDFSVRSQGLTSVLNTTKPAELDWNLKSYRNEKSVSYENRYTELVYEYEEGKDNYLSAASKLDEKTAEDLTYVAFKQDFFTSILLTDTPIKNAQLKSENLVNDETVDTVFTKNFSAKLPLEFKGGELSYNMNWYYGPADYKI